MNGAPDLARAAAMAYRLLIRAQVRTLPVDPLALLRRCRHTRVCTYEEMQELLALTDAELSRLTGPAEAFTFRQESEGQAQYLVAYQAEGHPARMRFTLAHELGHRVLGHTGENPSEEQEADEFANHLLCPRPVIACLAERFRPLYAEQVADVCYVSLTCARKVRLGGDIPPSLLRQVEELLKEAAETAEPVTAQRSLHRCRLYPE